MSGGSGEARTGGPQQSCPPSVPWQRAASTMESVLGQAEGWKYGQREFLALKELLAGCGDETGVHVQHSPGPGRHVQGAADIVLLLPGPQDTEATTQGIPGVRSCEWCWNREEGTEGAAPGEEEDRDAKMGENDREGSKHSGQSPGAGPLSPTPEPQPEPQPRPSSQGPAGTPWGPAQEQTRHPHPRLSPASRPLGSPPAPLVRSRPRRHRLHEHPIWSSTVGTSVEPAPSLSHPQAPLEPGTVTSSVRLQQPHMHATGKKVPHSSKRNGKLTSTSKCAHACAPQLRSREPKG